MKSHQKFTSHLLNRTFISVTSNISEIFSQLSRPRNSSLLSFLLNIKSIHNYAPYSINNTTNTSQRTKQNSCHQYVNFIWLLETEYFNEQKLILISFFRRIPNDDQIYAIAYQSQSHEQIEDEVLEEPSKHCNQKAATLTNSSRLILQRRQNLSIRQKKTSKAIIRLTIQNPAKIQATLVMQNQLENSENDKQNTIKPHEINPRT